MGTGEHNQSLVSAESHIHEDMDHHDHDNEGITPSSSSACREFKRLQAKRWRIVSSSDEDADTLKDRFWRNLEAGILPEDLVGDDLYSSVRMQVLTNLQLRLCCNIRKFTLYCSCLSIFIIHLFFCSTG